MAPIFMKHNLIVSHFKIMDQIVSNPGLQHIAEKIFITLNYEDILSCRLLNKSSNLILEDPMLWLWQGISKGLSKENQEDWINVIKLTKDTKLESNITKYLRRVAKKSFYADVPCFINQNVLEVFLNTDFEIPYACIPNIIQPLRLLPLILQMIMEKFSLWVLSSKIQMLQFQIPQLTVHH